MSEWSFVTVAVAGVLGYLMPSYRSAVLGTVVLWFLWDTMTVTARVDEIPLLSFYLHAAILGLGLRIPAALAGHWIRTREQRETAA